MNKQQILWAAQHDWYSHCNGDVVYVTDNVLQAGVWVNKTVAFNNFRELREWAGY